MEEMMLCLKEYFSWLKSQIFQILQVYIIINVMQYLSENTDTEGKTGLILRVSQPIIQTFWSYKNWFCCILEHRLEMSF